MAIFLSSPSLLPPSTLPSLLPSLPPSPSFPSSFLPCLLSPSLYFPAIFEEWSADSQLMITSQYIVLFSTCYEVWTWENIYSDETGHFTLKSTSVTAVYPSWATMKIQTDPSWLWSPWIKHEGTHCLILFVLVSLFFSVVVVVVVVVVVYFSYIMWNHDLHVQHKVFSKKQVAEICVGSADQFCGLCSCRWMWGSLMHERHPGLQQPVKSTIV